MGIEAINPFELPLLNTVILLSSGVTVTYAHHSLIQGNRKGTLYGLVATIILAIIFTAFQGIEYTVSSFTISDGAFGSFFFWYRLSWTTCYDWYCFLNSGIVKSACLSFYIYAPPRLRVRHIILTFC